MYLIKCSKAIYNLTVARVFLRFAQNFYSSGLFGMISLKAQTLK